MNLFSGNSSTLQADLAKKERRGVTARASRSKGTVCCVEKKGRIRPSLQKKKDPQPDRDALRLSVRREKESLSGKGGKGPGTGYSIKKNTNR